LIFGSLFLAAFAGGLAGLYSLRRELVTVAGVRERLTRLLAGTWIMAAVAWITVLSGTYLIYPWYRAAAKDSPRSLLLADPTKKLWHTFGMEWKEHIGWFAPILATAVAFIVAYYGPQLAEDNRLRKAAIWLFAFAFFAAAVAGVFGAFLNKAAPVH
jgi:MFS family permease